MEFLTKTPDMIMIQDPAAEDPKIDHQAALYFLDGHYLFRSRSGGGWSSKFVTAADVSAAFLGSETDTGWLPAGVVRAGSNAKGKWFVYSAPAQKVTIGIEREEGTLTIPIPRTVLIGAGRDYHIFAMHAKHFSADDPVFRAPFPNVHGDGRICWGANTPKPAEPSNAREVWNLFFSTPFNHDLVTEKSKAFPGNVLDQLRALDGLKVYPVDDLEKHAQTMRYCINNLLGVA